MTDFNPNEPNFDPSTLPDDLVPPSEQRLSPRQRNQVLAPLDSQIAAAPARGRGAVWAPVLVAATLVVALVIGYQTLGQGTQIAPGGTISPTLRPSQSPSSSSAPSSVTPTSQTPSQTPSQSPSSTASTDSEGTDQEKPSYPPIPSIGKNLTGEALAKDCFQSLANTDLPGAGSNYKVVSTSPDGLLAVVSNGTYYSLCDGFDKLGNASMLKPMKLSVSPTDKRQFYFSEEGHEPDAGGLVPAGQVWEHFFAGGNAKGIASVTYEFNVRLDGQSQTVVAKAVIANGYWTMAADAKFTTAVDSSYDLSFDTKVTVVTTSGQTKVIAWTWEELYSNLEIICRHGNHGC